MAKKTLLSEGHIRKFMKLAAYWGLLPKTSSQKKKSQWKKQPNSPKLKKSRKRKKWKWTLLKATWKWKLGDEEMEMDAPADDGEDAIKAALEQLIDAIKAAPETDIAVETQPMRTDEMTEPMDENGSLNGRKWLTQWKKTCTKS